MPQRYYPECLVHTMIGWAITFGWLSQAWRFAQFELDPLFEGMCVWVGVAPQTEEQSWPL